MPNKEGRAFSGRVQMWIAVIGAITSIGVAWISGYYSAQRNLNEGLAFAPLGSGQKLCSVTDGHWRDSFVVPKTWKSSQCESFKTQTAATLYQLGCVFPDSVVLGTFGGGSPSPNCGW